MAGQTIRIQAADGSGSFGAYLALPPGGSGPGIVLAQEIFGLNEFVRQTADHYAEEGYVVIAPDLFWRQQAGVELGYSEAEWQQAFKFFQGFDLDKGVEDMGAALQALRARPEFVGKAGVLGFCLGGMLAFMSACRLDVDVAVGYYGVGMEHKLDEAAHIRGRLLLHFAEADGYCTAEARATIMQALQQRPRSELYVYPGVDHAFARPASPHFDKAASLMAHQRSVAAFKAELGPHYDFSALWDKHCEHEFASRDVDATMATMVAQPYVNHIPTMTGGVGHDALKRFYKYHFVNSNPPDTRLIPISRTIGATQIVDELLFCFTHSCEIDWMLPGVKPTGRAVQIPLVAIVKFRGDKLYHEHIYWDQASVLVQIGLLDPAGLPVAGMETAHKLLDEKLPSNGLMARWSNSQGQPL
ncbi:carboxymethylenebutenolidase [Paucibacter oligotrophus]|uniref:Carboxymethylenebutenolidase n=1 Tax=Roseateles oligotrophus TaxID=1769250 RepID=A0A840L5N0_9BURK|nr:dienelactone hydrolase family protein [Roseateles oligotrophus]MBB4841855.1 carboxymethylenebutenolidase [Roseateles oligotrophus]